MSSEANVSRRTMLRSALGAAASTGLLLGHAQQGDASVRIPHLVPKAKHVIFCFMQGGMSHVDIFDPKPMLDKHDEKPTFNDNIQSQGPGNRKWLKSPWKFRQHGESGIPLSSLLPHLATCVDDLTVIRSMRAGLPLHSVGNLFLHSGRNRAGYPS